ncbi:MAG: retropepsin-like domain-containing protein [Deltaproteobacteria bacterium]|nr:retropepsin-like domain-containing protein [Deltaproteobacteria bacterium]
MALPPVALALCAGVGLGSLRGGPPLLIIGLPFGAALVGLAALRRSPLAAPLLGMASATLLYAFPLYLPGERGAALGRGLALAAAPASAADPAVSRRWGAWGNIIDKLLPGAPAGRVLVEAPLASAPEAPPAAPPPAPAEVPGGEDAHDHVVLPYEGSGNALHVPVEIEGPRGELVEVTMIFDTGASFTTLDTATLHRLGLRVPADAPEVRVHTAAGERSSRLVLVPRVWLGGLQVEGVTVGVCDDCANGVDVGLLGLNVSGRFLTTVDQARREILLRPRQGPDDRLADVRYWVELGAEATRWPDGQIEARVRLENRADRDILGATVELRCDEVREVKIGRVRAGRVHEEEVRLPTGIDCDPYEVALSAARW